ncbi:pyrroline-5-carboxylate reductase [Cytobacillus firmus]|uniref:pyrroline-5-carboxylate reductase n=1 Tax=Cytobacillus firmus TaxID=1399 RepID=UPI001580E50A|nr:pyrroline-5-carboxylate reductase [Cytobacillus firmus]MBG9654075.1 pyrroline-5-carboxylate reductase [Cytobacillus firmus]MDD9314376.1 pyrroline-5-carboxylate reductase [Cytobacillus firmus]MED1907050.1 pyrroline-5-carboxylate reductase [Cytobacillus firmus]NUH84595.1 pyrroline-5-carboxylate reductase [Cytobacillus firmus]
MLANKTIAFLGAGSMAESMISGVITAEKMSPERVFVTNRSNADRLKEIHDQYGVCAMPQNELPFEEIDLFILAMKPKGAEEALRSIKDKLYPGQVILSVLAGITTEFMEEHLNPGQQVVRVMPNTSSMIQESATAVVAGKNTSMANVEMVKELLECMGEVYIIDEDQMDVFTGLAGSGPAYFYYLMENMEQVGVQNGMDEKTVRKIVAQTIFGAAKMVLEKEEAPTSLREKVTSPNGTTASGLEALRRYNGGEAITQAVEHAAKRSKEISKELEDALVTS